MSLDTVWYVLIAALFIGYFFLEGFDYGVGMLLPVVGRTDAERRAVLGTIGPVWDANEVWLITAAGAMFAAFPAWYATLFSAFYLPLSLLLLALVFRGVAVEFRSKRPDSRWRRFADAAIAAGSTAPPVVWGLALANLLHGVPLQRNGVVAGPPTALLSPYAIVGALTVVALFALHGALYLALKTEGTLHRRARVAAFRLGAPATALFFLFVVLSYYNTRFPARFGVDPGAVPILAGLSMVSVRFLLKRDAYGAAFVMNGLAMVLSLVTVFLTLYPDLLISTLNRAWSLTVSNAAANPYSLRVMTGVAVAALPVVLLYQAWSYWVFRERVSAKRPGSY